MRVQQRQKTQESGNPNDKLTSKTQSIYKPWDFAMNDILTSPLRIHLTGISCTASLPRATLFMLPAGQTPLLFEKLLPSAGISSTLSFLTTRLSSETRLTISKALDMLTHVFHKLNLCFSKWLYSYKTIAAGSIHFHQSLFRYFPPSKVFLSLDIYPKFHSQGSEKPSQKVRSALLWT